SSNTSAFTAGRTPLYTVTTGTAAPTNWLDWRFAAGGDGTMTGPLILAAGSTAAATAPMYWTSAPLMTTPEVGAMEFLTDKWYATITTGAARKELALVDAALTSGRIVVATTNGRIKDFAALIYDASSTPTVQLQGNTPLYIADNTNNGSTSSSYFQAKATATNSS